LTLQFSFRSSKISLLLLLLLLLSSSSSLVLIAPVHSSAVASASPNSIVYTSVSKQIDSQAGYSLRSSSAGSVIMTQATWFIPSVTCSSSAPSAFLQFYVQIAHITGSDVGTQLVVTCSGLPLSPQYTLNYYIGSSISGSLHCPPICVSPGDKMLTNASEIVSTGVTTLIIRDLTKAWYVSGSGSEPVEKSEPSSAEWVVAEPGGGTSGRPLLQFSTIKVSAITAEVGGYKGNLGSFIKVSKIGVNMWIFEDLNNKHTLAKPTSITSTSSSFKIKWVQGS
jgi:hypothetical protein